MDVSQGTVQWVSAVSYILRCKLELVGQYGSVINGCKSGYSSVGHYDQLLIEMQVRTSGSVRVSYK